MRSEEEMKRQLKDQRFIRHIYHTRILSSIISYLSMRFQDRKRRQSARRLTYSLCNRLEGLRQGQIHSSPVMRVDDYDDEMISFLRTNVFYVQALGHMWYRT